jgi:hypothetical protein
MQWLLQHLSRSDSSYARGSGCEEHGVCVREDSLVEDTVGVGGARANREDVSMKTLRIVVNIIQLGTSGVPACDHGAHTQTIPSVSVPGGGHGGEWDDRERTLYWREVWKLQQQKFAPCSEVHTNDTVFLNLFPRTDNQQHHQPLFQGERD